MTAQETDRILIDGVQHELFTNPLEMYRETYRRDIVFFQDHPNTACWRGYVAEWEIVEGKLFLLKVNGNVSYKGVTPILFLAKTPDGMGYTRNYSKIKCPQLFLNCLAP